MTTPPTAIEEAAAAISELGATGVGRLGVACSGGVDSVLLLHIVAETWRDSAAPPLCIHVDHQLRGAESDADRGFVTELARSRGLPCEIIGTTVESGPGSLEDRARRARYAAFRTAATGHRLDALLLAHHADDQAESVILRILRGSGPRGLRGMPRERLLLPGCRLLRPWLGIRRARIVAAARALGLSWREDSSNRDLRHERNRVRRVVLPALEKREPRTHERLVAIAADSARIWEALGAAARWRLESALLHRAPDLAVLRGADLEPLDGDLLFAVLESCMAPPPGAATPRHGDLPLARRVISGESPAATLGSGWEIRRMGGLITLDRPIPTAEPAPLSIPGSLPWPGIGGVLEARIVTEAEAEAVAAALRQIRDDPRRVFADMAGVVEPVTVRPWAPGMRYRPLGAPGRRHVADIWGERRVPRALRPRLPVIADAEGVLWAPPGPPAERVRLHRSSTRVLEIRWRAGPPAAALGAPGHPRG